MSLAPTQSAAKAFVRSPALVRNRTSAPSIFQIVTVRVPLWGFGSFISGGDYSSWVTFTDFSDPRIPTTNDVWPAVYNNLKETWAQSDGGSGACETSFSPFFDIMATISGSGTFPNGFPNFTVVSQTITDSTVTILYTLNIAPPGLPPSYVTGTYTASLDGTILQPLGTPGPFDINDPSWGWGALTRSAQAILDLVAVPSQISPNSGVTVLDAVSTGPGYDSNFFEIFATAGGSTTVDPILAAANGFYMRPVTASDAGLWQDCEFAPPIAANIQDLTPYTAVPGMGFFQLNQGACFCAKSQWVISGEAPTINTVPLPSQHRIIYIQPVNVLGGFSTGTVSPASSFPNPLPYPQTYNFSYTDVEANSATLYGMLGFQSTAA